MCRFMRYLPMSYDVLCENVLDPSHVRLAAIGWSAEPGHCPLQAPEHLPLPLMCLI